MVPIKLKLCIAYGWMEVEVKNMHEFWNDYILTMSPIKMIYEVCIVSAHPENH